jgi:hypothetical protein
MLNQEPNKTLKRIRMKFQPEEDEKLRQLVAQYGTNSWELISQKMEGRNVRQCRERWSHYLCSETAKRPWTEEEDATLLKKVEEFGTKWSKIITFLNDRTDIQAKTRWLRITGRRTVHEFLPRNTFQVQDSSDLKPATPTVTEHTDNITNVQNTNTEYPLEVPVNTSQQVLFQPKVDIQLNSLTQYVPQLNSSPFQTNDSFTPIFEPFTPSNTFSVSNLFMNTEDYDPEDEIQLLMPKDDNFYDNSWFTTNLF